MDPSRFQRHVDALLDANAAQDAVAIAAALKDVSRATYRDYTIKSFLAEAGTFPALVTASSILPSDGTAEEAHSSVALCLWGLMIGHRPNKIKLVEQGGLPVLIKGLGMHSNEDCAQYSALAIWSLAYSVPENQLAAAESIPALKALLAHRSGLVQYAAAGALWAVSSHPLNRDQLARDERLLATLLLFLPKSAPPLDESPSPALPAPLSASPHSWRPVQQNRPFPLTAPPPSWRPVLENRPLPVSAPPPSWRPVQQNRPVPLSAPPPSWLPVQQNRPVRQSNEGPSAVGASTPEQEHGRVEFDSIGRPVILRESEDEPTGRSREYTEERTLSDTVGPAERVFTNRSAGSTDRFAGSIDRSTELRGRDVSSEVTRSSSPAATLEAALHLRARLAETSSQLILLGNESTRSRAPGEGSSEGANGSASRPPSEAGGSFPERQEPPCHEPPTNSPPSDRESAGLNPEHQHHSTEALRPSGEPAEQALLVEEVPSANPNEPRHRTAYREIRESWLEAAERLSENLQRQTDYLGRRTQRLRGLSRIAPSVTEAAAAAARVNAESASRSVGMTSEPSPTSVLGSSLDVSLPRGMPDLEEAQSNGSPLSDASPGPVLSVASGLGSESAGVWASNRESDTSPIPVLTPHPAQTNSSDGSDTSSVPAPGPLRPQTNAAIEELRTLVRTERARAEAFVARARSLVDEEREIRGNISNLERELAVAVRERDAAVAERDRTSAVLGRALAALSSARDQLAVLGGSLRASNPAAPLPIAPVPTALATSTGHDEPTPGVQPEEYELLEMLDSATAPPNSDSRKACLMACLLLGNLSLSPGTKDPDPPTVVGGEQWSEAMAGVLRFVTGLGALDAIWATMLWTTVQPLVDLLQSPEAVVQALALFIVVDLCTGNEHKHKFILEGAVPHLNLLCGSPSPLVRRLARSALLQLGMQPPVASPDLEVRKVERPLDTGSGRQDDVGECVICCDEVSSASFEPCGHVVSCLRCAQCLVARGDRCPLCRVAIGSVKTLKAHVRRVGS